MSKSKVRIRVASTLGEPLPVWLEIPVVIHRPMPADGVIRSAALIRERIALAWRYRLIITVACANSPASVAAERPSIAIDLGWRLTTGGLRLAYWADTLDSHGELVIPASDVEEFSKVAGLWSVLDKQFAQIRGAVLVWRTARQIPEVLIPYLDRVAANQSRQNLLGLIDAWQKNRSAGDDEIISELLAWRKRHLHLWTWAVNLRDQLTRRRLELFRNFAAELMKTYGTVFLEDFDLRWFARIPPPEMKGIATGGKYRVLAAPGILRRVIENACRRSGVRLEYIKARNTTKTCHVCGRIEEWNAARQLVHTCNCGATWDQDYNAAVQILRAGETPGGAGTVQGGLIGSSLGSSKF